MFLIRIVFDNLGLLAAITLGLLFGLVIGSISLGALYVHRRRSFFHLLTYFLQGYVSLI